MREATKKNKKEKQVLPKPKKKDYVLCDFVLVLRSRFVSAVLFLPAIKTDRGERYFSEEASREDKSSNRALFRFVLVTHRNQRRFSFAWMGAG